MGLGLNAESFLFRAKNIFLYEELLKENVYMIKDKAVERYKNYKGSDMEHRDTFKSRYFIHNIMGGNTSCENPMYHPTQSRKIKNKRRRAN
jgi:hypothetical protein